MTDTNALKGKIRSSGYKISWLAGRMHITPAALNNKIKNATEFKAGEIKLLCDLLHISLEEKEAIFFCSMVDDLSTY